jgi:hypothetical protein
MTREALMFTQPERSIERRQFGNEQIEVTYPKAAPIDVPQARYPGFKQETKVLRFDKNSLWNGLNVPKEGGVCQEEKFTRYGGVSNRHGDTGTKSFRSGRKKLMRHSPN